MADERTPALTLEEWTAFRHAMLSRAAQENHGEHFARGDAVLRAVERVDFHAVAVLALFRQPFGFTREHVRQIHEARLTIEGEFGRDHPDELALRRIGEIIAALLPPE